MQNINLNSLKNKLLLAKLNDDNLEILHHLQSFLNTAMIQRLANDRINFLHQGAFLSQGYLCLVWLWESVKSLKVEPRIIEILNKKIEIDIIKITFAGKDRQSEDWKALLNTIRNAISHGSVKVDDEKFYFINKDPRNVKNKNKQRKVEITWENFAKLTGAMIESIEDYVKEMSN